MRLRKQAPGSSQSAAAEIGPLHDTAPRDAQSEGEGEGEAEAEAEGEVRGVR